MIKIMKLNSNIFNVLRFLIKFMTKLILSIIYLIIYVKKFIFLSLISFYYIKFLCQKSYDTYLTAIEVSNIDISTASILRNIDFIFNITNIFQHYFINNIFQKVVHVIL